MSYTTQCPACQTRFKVSDDHLALAAGMVRCGRCNHVFHAPSHFDAPVVQPAPQAEPPRLTPVTEAAPTAADDDFELELPDFTPEPVSQTAAPATSAAKDSRSPEPVFDVSDFDLLPEAEQPLSWDDLATPGKNENAAPAPSEPAPAIEEPQSNIADFQRALAEALQPPPPSSFATAARIMPQEEAPAVEPSTRQQRLAARYEQEDNNDERIEPGFTDTAIPQASTTPEPNTVDDSVDEEPATKGNPRWMITVIYSLLATIGVLLLLLQLVFINRTTVSAELPELRPAFESLCKTLGCEVPLPTRRQLIRTEWSELSFVAQQDKLIQLDATLKNLAPYPQAFPLMEVTLKDANDRVLIRKTLTPQQYLSAADLKLGRFNANSELKIVVRMEVKDAKALGYSLYFYY